MRKRRAEKFGERRTRNAERSRGPDRPPPFFLLYLVSLLPVIAAVAAEQRARVKSPEASQRGEPLTSTSCLLFSRGLFFSLFLEVEAFEPRLCLAAARRPVRPTITWAELCCRITPLIGSCLRSKSHFLSLRWLKNSALVFFIPLVFVEFQLQMTLFCFVK